MEDTNAPEYNEKVCAQCRFAIRRMARDKKAKATGKYWRCTSYGKPALYCFAECKKYKDIELKLKEKEKEIKAK